MQVLFAPGISASEIINPFADTGLLVSSVTESNESLRIGRMDNGMNLPPILWRRFVSLDVYAIEPPTPHLVLVPVGVLFEHCQTPLTALGRGRPLVIESAANP